MIAGPFLSILGGGDCVLASTVLAYLTDIETDMQTRYFSCMQSGEGINKNLWQQDVIFRLRDLDKLCRRFLRTNTGVSINVQEVVAANLYWYRLVFGSTADRLLPTRRP
jgi:hypothetical protein